jgi:TetR/AcrR family transcriptional regulator
MATRDPEATKARILAAALREFSDKGISGARVDAIAARAKVNKRMLYYYFGSKEGLFREILRRRLHERSVAVRTTGIGQPNRLAVRHQQLVGDRDYARLLMWEALETEPDHPANEAVRTEFFHSWVATVEAEQEAGRLPADLDPAQLVLTELCIVLGPMLLPQLTYLVTGHRVDDAAFAADRREFLEALGRRLDRAPVPTSNASR